MKTNASGETYVAEMSFKDAARLVCRAWRKSHGYRTPALSHALSIYEDSVWIVLDSEAGEVVAHVHDGVVVLAEDFEEVPQ